MGESVLQRTPTIILHEGNPTVRFDSLPVWEGVQSAPGVRQVLPFALVAGVGCPISQVSAEKSTAELVTAYHSEDYHFITSPPGASAWANSLGERSIQAVVSAVGTDLPESILEIGGGSTWIAQRLRQRYQPETYLIVDPSVRDMAEGVEVINEYFPCAEIADRRYDLILGFSVLEHVPEPFDFLRNIRNHLNQAGKVVLIFPDCERQLRLGDLNVLVHEHISYFTEASARSMAALAGFKVASLQSNNDVFTMVLELSASTPEIDRVTDDTELLLHGARMFQNLLTDTCTKINNYLEAGQRVAFHGATNGLNTFFFVTGLGGHPGIRLYDGDAAKVGFYLPACSTPILSSSDSRYASNSLVVVSAMSFFDQIERFVVEKVGIDRSRLIPLVAN